MFHMFSLQNNPVHKQAVHVDCIHCSFLVCLQPDFVSRVASKAIASALHAAEGCLDLLPSTMHVLYKTLDKSRPLSLWCTECSE